MACGMGREFEHGSISVSICYACLRITLILSLVWGRIYLSILLWDFLTLGYLTDFVL